MKVRTTPMNPPTTAQKGRTMPTITMDRSKTRLTGVACRKFCVVRVRSSHGFGSNWYGVPRTDPVSEGMPT